MSKILFLGIALLLSLPVLAQRGDEFLVYSVKGKVTSVYKSRESQVKIGKVLVPGTIVKTDKNASLTMLCSRGKPISLVKQGSFPVNKWRDSCKITGNSISSNYFKYIWGEMYSYSPEHKKELQKRSMMAVSRGHEPPIAKSVKKPLKVEFSKGMDTVNFDGTPFPLSWNVSNYRGLYYFTLYEANGSTMIYTDSLRSSYIPIDSFRHLLVPGNRYSWSVMAKDVPVSVKKVLNYVNPDETSRLREGFLQPLFITEDSAAIFFRTAFMLEQRHFLAEAFKWYQQAAQQNPEMELYRDQLIRFRNEYWIR